MKSDVMGLHSGVSVVLDALQFKDLGAEVEVDRYGLNTCYSMNYPLSAVLANQVTLQHSGYSYQIGVRGSDLCVGELSLNIRRKKK